MAYLDEFISIWEAVKSSLKEKYSPSFVNLWFEDLRVDSFKDSTITFLTNSEFKYNIITEKHIPILKEGFSLFLGFEPEISLIFKGETPSIETILENAKKQDLMNNGDEVRRSASFPSGVIPQNYKFNYTFDNFIVGSSNKFAHAACTAVAENPADTYNPLFIYGPSGLGKTHLLSAIVNRLQERNPSTRVIYIKGDEFTNQMIEALSKQEMHEFRNKYRNCDVILIDDIQFIAGKTSTQEEFFHTFNTLFEDGKQIILTSDRPPKDIQTLEERLKTRFEWGLLADIQPPDIELRIAIIRKKAEQVSLVIPDDVLYFIADNLCSNIRQIEGVIKKLKAMSFLQNNPVSMDMAKSCITEFLGGAVPVNVTIDKIFATINNQYHFSKNDLTGPRRVHDLAMCRHLTIYVIREITEMSFPSIAKIFNRDNATVRSSYELIANKCETDTAYKITVDELIRNITG